jgi:hypothetical protein
MWAGRKVRLGRMLVVSRIAQVRVGREGSRVPGWTFAVAEWKLVIRQSGYVCRG